MVQTYTLWISGSDFAASLGDPNPSPNCIALYESLQKLSSMFVREDKELILVWFVRIRGFCLRPSWNFLVWNDECGEEHAELLIVGPLLLFIPVVI